MAKDNSEVDIIEEDYMVHGVTSMKDLVLKHLDRISVYGFKGDVNPSHREGKEGVIITPIDRRVVVIQALDFLQSILKPYYDEPMKEYQKVFDALIEIYSTLLI